MICYPDLTSMKKCCVKCKSKKCSSYMMRVLHVETTACEVDFRAPPCTKGWICTGYFPLSVGCMAQSAAMVQGRSLQHKRIFRPDKQTSKTIPHSSSYYYCKQIGFQTSCCLSCYFPQFLFFPRVLSLCINIKRLFKMLS